MSNVLSEPSPTITFTDAALAKISVLLVENGGDDLKLRVSVSGGGCSGFRYAFSFEKTVADDDFQMEKGGIAILVDATSMQYLAGAEIGYEDENNSGRFTIENVTASTACGCDSASV